MNYTNTLARSLSLSFAFPSFPTVRERERERERERKREREKEREREREREQMKGGQVRIPVLNSSNNQKHFLPSNPLFCYFQNSILELCVFTCNCHLILSEREEERGRSLIIEEKF